MLIGVAGMAGAGKSTLARSLASRFGLQLALESVDEHNPWLERFYGGGTDDMRRYALRLQLHFLTTRFEAMRRMRGMGGSWVLDRTWYEDAEIFARGLAEQELMSPDEWELYARLYRELLHAPAARPPRLLVYLRAPLPTLLERIRRRGRAREQDVDVGAARRRASADGALARRPAARRRRAAANTACPGGVVAGMPACRASIPARDFLRAIPAAAALLLSLGACRGGSGPDRASDSGLARDLGLANVVAAQQEFNDAPMTASSVQVGTAPEPTSQVAATSRPRREQQADRRGLRPSPPPAEAPPVPREERGIIRETGVPAPEGGDSPAPGPARGEARGFAAGTRLTLSTEARVCTVSGRPGDKMVATLSQPVLGTGGAVIGEGSSIVLEVASLEPGETPESGRITFRVRSIELGETSYRATGSGTAQGDLQRAQVSRVNASDRRKVVTGAVAGAILGRVLGGDTRGAVIGAAAGGAAGAARAKSNQQFEGCLPPGSAVTIVLEDDVTVGGA